MKDTTDPATTADVRIAIAADGMAAVVEAYTPPGPGQPALSAAVLTRRLRDRNVTQTSGPDFDRVLSNAQRGKDVTGEVVIRGVPAMEPRDAQISFLGDMALPVLSGEAIARLVPAQKPIPGTSVTGTPVLPKSDRKPDEIECSEARGCLLDEQDMTIRSKGYGLVDYRNRKLIIKPLFRISPDKLQVRARLYPTSFSGQPLTLPQVKRDLWQLGIQTAEDASIEQGLALATTTGEAVEDILVARGTPPRHGKDGRFEILLEDQAPPGDDQETYDPRERSIFKQVREGALIGRLHPPKEGKFGRDVFGEDLVPRRGQPVDVAPGENVTLGPDGVDFFAAIPGMVTWEGNRISVLEVIHVEGDVNYSTGNIRLERGTVFIDGSVCDGFIIAAPGDIVLGGTAEGCRLLSSRNVGVSGGIVQGGMGRVQAQGDVSAAFIENSTIEAGGNVTVIQNVANSTIRAGGKLVCVRGKGILFGGETTVGKGLEVNELGTEFGVKTLVTIDAGLELDDSGELLAERRTLREKRIKIETAIGADSPKAILERTAPAKRAEVGQLLKLRIAIGSRLEEIENELAARRQALEIYPSLRIKVRRKAHPGVIISIAGKRAELHETTEACSFYFDPGTMAIVKA